MRRRSRPQVTCAHQSPSSTLSRRQALSIFALITPALLQPGSAFAAQPVSEELSPLAFEKLPCPDEQCRPVEYHDYRVGTGSPVQQGSIVVLKWTGRLADRYGWPIQNEEADEVKITLGKDKLIIGFEMALMGMREGGKRRMLIPSELGYLDERSGPLPASYGDRRRLFATVLNQRRFKRAGDLVIDVQLLRVRNAQQ
ncbi:FKBP-type peptidyl-prolyl cis-trans isomerase [Gracilaria domingensis]|nr:FKBP-type peptidyl-prolyl cis-trans isomerase [Gracilaria domingensis]